MNVIELWIQMHTAMHKGMGKLKSIKIYPTFWDLTLSSVSWYKVKIRISDPFINISKSICDFLQLNCIFRIQKLLTVATEIQRPAFQGSVLIT